MEALMISMAGVTLTGIDINGATGVLDPYQRNWGLGYYPYNLAWSVKTNKQVDIFQCKADVYNYGSSPESVGKSG
jgi:hypothetical protein